MDIKALRIKLKYTTRYGIHYLFWRVLEKTHMVSPGRAQHYREDYYQNLTPEQREQELKERFAIKVGYPLNLENPKTFDEKLQWLKLYDSTPLKTKLTDKIEVRNWITEKIGEEYLIPIIGIWDTFEDIDFDNMPDDYAIQCSHGCGMILIVRQNKPLDKDVARKKFHRWMNTNYGLNSRFELHYRDIKPRIIATKYLENIEGDLFDYKIYCFNGVPKYVNVIKGRYSDERMSFYDLDWNKQGFYYAFDHMRGDDDYCERPKKLEQAIELARILSEGFAYVRVDFYLLEDGEIYFGEMTFTPFYGEMNWTPKEADRALGDILVLPDEKYILK